MSEWAEPGENGGKMEEVNWEGLSECDQVCQNEDVGPGMIKTGAENLIYEAV